MRRQSRLLVDAIAALAIGAAGAVWGVHHIHVAGQESVIPPGDRVEGAVAALRESSVYVAPDGRSMMSRSAERDLESTIAGSTVPVHVVVWRPSREAGGEPYSFALSETFAEELGEPGVYVVWQGPEDADAAAGVGKRLDYDVPPLVEVGDAATRMTEFVVGLDEDSLIDDEEDEDSDLWAGIVAGTVAGLLIGIGIMVAAAAAYSIWRAVTGRRFLNNPPKEG